MFETGKLAMNIDGEYRTAFIDSEHPNLKYATAPMPVDDAQPNLYGAGYVTGNSLGIPRTSPVASARPRGSWSSGSRTDPAAQVPARPAAEERADGELGADRPVADPTRSSRRS